MYRDYRNVNAAFDGIVGGILSGSIPTKVQKTDNRSVIRIGSGPCVVTLAKPCERVLFNTNRDLNPFLAMDESVLMLSGMGGDSSYYAEDENNHFNIGTRFSVSDQLEKICNILYHIPDNRKCVMQIWDVTDLDSMSDTSTIPKCVSVLFEINQNQAFHALNMTVFSHEGNLIDDVLGYDSVRFSFLQEYVASKLTIKVGKYYHIVNNMYIDGACNLQPYSTEYKTMHSPEYGVRNQTTIATIKNPVQFEDECRRYVAGQDDESTYQEPFFIDVVLHMQDAFNYYKASDKDRAVVSINKIKADDWRFACKSWLHKRMR